MRKPKQMPAVDTNRVRDQVLLVVPARPEMWSIVRMTASVLAARLDLSFDGIEDLRLAVTELCSSCAVDTEVGATCDVRFEVSTDRFEMYLEVAPVRDSAPQESEPRVMSMLELSEQILRATVDSHTIDAVEDGVRRAYLCKECDPVATQ
jgi:hypothetical protein